MGSESTTFESAFESLLTPRTNLANSNTSQEHANTLETAYESLLSTREKLFSSEDILETGDDKLFNINLQTSYLFKALSEKAVVIKAKIQDLVENEKALDDALSKSKTSQSIFLAQCSLHHPSSTESLQQKFTSLNEDYFKLHPSIKVEIATKRGVLENELDTLNIKLNSLRKIIQTGIESIVKPDDMGKKMCPVCYEHEVCMVMIPCGHTYCDSCSKYDYRAKCPQCRTRLILV